MPYETDPSSRFSFLPSPPAVPAPERNSQPRAIDPNRLYVIFYPAAQTHPVDEEAVEEDEVEEEDEVDSPPAVALVDAVEDAVDSVVTAEDAVEDEVEPVDEVSPSLSLSLNVCQASH